jgi:hypothetical protein
MELTTFLKHQHLVKKPLYGNVLEFKIGALAREKYSHYYNNNIESKWTPIELIIKDIKVGKSQ